jgi:hypothetical protein
MNIHWELSMEHDTNQRTSIEAKTFRKNHRKQVCPEGLQVLFKEGYGLNKH